MWVSCWHSMVWLALGSATLLVYVPAVLFCYSIMASTSNQGTWWNALVLFLLSTESFSYSYPPDAFTAARNHVLCLKAFWNMYLWDSSYKVAQWNDTIAFTSIVINLSWSKFICSSYKVLCKKGPPAPTTRNPQPLHRFCEVSPAFFFKIIKSYSVQRIYLVYQVFQNWEHWSHPSGSCDKRSAVFRINFIYYTFPSLQARLRPLSKHSMQHWYPWKLCLPVSPGWTRTKYRYKHMRAQTARHVRQQLFQVLPSEYRTLFTVEARTLQTGRWSVAVALHWKRPPAHSLLIESLWALSKTAHNRKRRFLFVQGKTFRTLYNIRKQI